MMVMALVTDILFKLMEKFRSLAFRIQFITEKLHGDFVAVLTEMDRPQAIELMLKQEDINGKSVLAYLAELKLYSFLQINHVNRIAN